MELERRFFSLRQPFGFKVDKLAWMFWTERDLKVNIVDVLC